jgi:hypothetical protein
MKLMGIPSWCGDEVGSRRFYPVIPAKAGIHFDFALGFWGARESKSKMDSGFRRNDGVEVRGFGVRRLGCVASVGFRLSPE